MYYNITQDELRTWCRTNIESLEIWCRRLIDEKLAEKYGSNYIDAQDQAGNSIIKKDLKKHIHSMLEREPARFQRAVDTLFIDSIISILCHPKLYPEIFKPILDYAYPQGRDEAQEFLTRIVPVRNALSHANPISVRQAEQAICYSQDFIDGIKQFYKDSGAEKVWNVPRIIRFTDSLGNGDENPTDANTGRTIKTIEVPLHCGETYSITIEIDPSFESDTYSISWVNGGHACNDFANKKTFAITFSTLDVSETHLISCRVTSNKDWHKYRMFDCEVTWMLTVLPPSF